MKRRAPRPSTSKPIRSDLEGFINEQISKHHLKSDRVWAEIAQFAASCGARIDLAAYRVLHDHARRCHYIIENPLERRQRLLDWYTKHPELRVLTNKEVLKETAWWEKFYTVIAINYTEQRSEADWLLNEVSRNVGGTAAFLKNARVGLWVRPTGYQVVRNVDGRCYRYFEVILEGEGAFLVRASVLGKAAFYGCRIAEVTTDCKYINGRYIHTGSIIYK